jgi:hypothetical protein
MERYIDDRQEHIEMVDEHPDNIVSQRLVVSLDESQFHAHRDTLAQLLQHYFVLMKVIGDNRSRIERPRGIESQYLSQFQ